MSVHLLTEAQAAETLQCRPSKIKRLRLSGQLAYIPGRPVLISQAAIVAYVERTECQSLISRKPTTGSTTPIGQTEREAKDRAWELKVLMKRR
jgi:hypothetical protein